MAYSIKVIKVVILLWVSISRTEPTRTPRDNSDLPIASELLSYVRPYIKAFKLGPNPTYKKSHEKSIVENAIDDKIQELKHFLQDDDENNLELEGDEETTIIEFTPRVDVTNENNEKNSFEKKLKKYEKMRNKIKQALEKETVSNKTKKTVAKTLDGLMATLVESQCPWNFKSKNVLRANFFDTFWNKTNILRNFTKPEKLTKEGERKVKEALKNEAKKGVYKKAMKKEAKKGVHKVKNAMKAGAKKAMNNIIDELSKSNPDIPSSLMNLLNETVSNVVKNSQTLNNSKYKIKCIIMDMEKTKDALRQKDICDNFRICSEELKHFLNEFYRSLNETAVSTLKNYASIYATDVNTDDSEEKKWVMTVIKRISKITEERVRRGFVKKVSKFTLDENKNVNANVEKIKVFVRNTIKHIIKDIKKHVETDLSSLRTKLVTAIKNDIHINLKVELGNIESDTIGRICQSFVTCNGKLSGSLRKFESSETVTNGNNVYVKVQLALDDELQDSLMKSHRKMVNKPKFQIGGNVNKHEHLTSNTKIRATRTTMQITDIQIPHN